LTKLGAFRILLKVSNRIEILLIREACLVKIAIKIVLPIENFVEIQTPFQRYRN